MSGSVLNPRMTATTITLYKCPTFSVYQMLFYKLYVLCLTQSSRQSHQGSITTISFVQIEEMEHKLTQSQTPSNWKTQEVNPECGTPESMLLASSEYSRPWPLLLPAEMAI